MSNMRYMLMLSFYNGRMYRKGEFHVLEWFPGHQTRLVTLQAQAQVHLFISHLL